MEQTIESLIIDSSPALDIDTHHKLSCMKDKIIMLKMVLFSYDLMLLNRQTDLKTVVQAIGEIECKLSEICHSLIELIKSLTSKNKYLKILKTPNAETDYFDVIKLVIGELA